MVRLLIERGADVEAPGHDVAEPAAGLGDRRQRMRLGHDPDADWAATVRVLLDAGAAVETVSWNPDKPPSADVAEVLPPFGFGPGHASA